MKLAKVYSAEKSTRFQICEPYTFQHIDGRIVEIPQGYRSDLASVPRFLWWFIPPHGHSAEASIIHDYLYDYRIGTRLDADLKFYRDLYSVLPKWQSMLMFLTVRFFAESWWRN